MAGLTITQKKEWAQQLYLIGELNQKEIAEKVKVTEKTMGKWVKDGDWEVLKSALVITREAELRRIYFQVKELNDAIAEREKGQRFPTAAEANTLSQLASTIRTLESDAALTDIISVFKRFTEWLKKVDLEAAQGFIEYQDAFIKDVLSKI